MEIIRLYNTRSAILAGYDQQYYQLNGSWNEIVNRKGLFPFLQQAIKQQTAIPSSTAAEMIAGQLIAPIGSQEVWAAGVTYYRSRTARMEESEISGGATFYDKVYVAERPELFFKATPHRVSGHGQEVYIREDSTWDVPEPELTLFISSEGSIEGYTIGNDMSSRSIEGENPLYLPQAKVYEKCAGMGPCLMVPSSPIPPDTQISLSIFRDNKVVYTDSVPISQMKRGHQELVDFLYRGCAFPDGCYLMTGTCLVPDNSFTLQDHDRVEISIDHIGQLTNHVMTYRK
ncbi:2-dehydro-3-deoxy-D-arabinonate dehydratase [Chitinophaga terrae (ex Kim and Jung 2007)]|uniref:2-dehydro-3-deoxy-D-arabinonate dehydratase n=1 Tax=Chitinophaga terrae (ex Kim and Jung 2007) TaxID=408074 RepID=A0A1H4G979_9BACT|nr:fumarylacetoacetate hydrolase family protein [Chitinophaga terrae (ex Kim and Jung 2007)]MDQ0109052.1 2-dehydro-3-deoxy-D-arabinonate dehydratase [Chitinophaga terrae (ex Kim and Jung 2007)]GEP93174.1 2-hydroxyhepta-2,4-diene-1,7-dioate isomerase [Chitinophaga terrae (ex Kim and Jung 2007)]SEB06149.1 2-dehydro-3-deoxy-D-arabinonate dehydratase [Chitinophaga terrae (ex Kim and Jung 2007)]